MSQPDPQPTPPPGDDDGPADAIDSGPLPSHARPEWITYIERSGTPAATEKRGLRS